MGRELPADQEMDPPGLGSPSCGWAAVRTVRGRVRWVPDVGHLAGLRVALQCRAARPGGRGRAGTGGQRVGSPRQGPDRLGNSHQGGRGAGRQADLPPLHSFYSVTRSETNSIHYLTEVCTACSTGLDKQ